MQFSRIMFSSFSLPRIRLLGGAKGRQEKILLHPMHPVQIASRAEDSLGAIRLLDPLGTHTFVAGANAVVLWILSVPTLLRLRDVCAITGLSKTAVYGAIRRHEFPRQVRLAGTRSVAWRADQVQCWIQSQPLAHPDECTRVQ